MPIRFAFANAKVIRRYRPYRIRVRLQESEVRSMPESEASSPNVFIQKRYDPLVGLWECDLVACRSAKSNRQSSYPKRAWHHRTKSLHNETVNMELGSDPNGKKEASSCEPKQFKSLAESVLPVMVKAGNAAVNSELSPALNEVELSQDGLMNELRALQAEMDRVSTNLGKVGVDELTLRRLKESKESLARTKKTLLKVHGRLGRLRTYEESDRLHRAKTEMERPSS